MTKTKHMSYIEYKPSGVRWLGDVPRYWEIKRLKFLAGTIMGQSPSSDSYTFDDSARPFLQGNAEFGEQYPTPKYFCEVATKQAPKGALLVSVRAPVGAMNVADRCYGIGRGLCAVVADGVSLLSDYLWYALTITRNELWSIATGSTYEAVSADEVASMTIVVPPPTEQEAIAAFLDRETGRIDGLIARKQRQIELLAEKRSALISHAVTKGLDPNVKMKDSGIEWLGQIPEHWEAVSLRRLLRVSSGDMISVNDFCEEGYPVFGGNGFRGYSDRWNTEGDTIIIGRYGALCGNVRVTEERIWATEHAFRVIPLASFHHKFLAAVIETLDLNRLSARTAQPGLNSEMVRNNVVGIPPISEQKAIADFMATETTRSDRLVFKIEASIAVLREFRSALISAAVTGRIDVRSGEKEE